MGSLPTLTTWSGVEAVDDVSIWTLTEAGSATYLDHEQRLTGRRRREK